MKELLAFFFILPLFCWAQIGHKSKCEGLKAKGYTQKFCDYNEKYAYKNISFESCFATVSSKLNLVKRSGAANQFNCKDDDILNWAGVKFDNCILDFSSSDKLDGVQLQLSSNDPTFSKAYIKSKMSFIKNYLTTYFGKPEIFPGTSLPMWRGNKVYITMSNFEDSDWATIAIYRTNINVVDNL